MGQRGEPVAERASATSAGARGAVRVGEALGPYLHTEAAELLRALRVHAESAGSAESATETAAAVRQLRGAAGRLGGALHAYRPLVDTAWADQLRAELGWLSDTLSRE
ncbi:CHAD domain-containing protein, partial [Streptomyces oceani]